MPDVAGARGQLKTSDFAAAVGIEQAELDALGVGRKDGKIGAASGSVGAEYLRGAGLEAR